MKPNRRGIYGFVKNRDVQPLLKSEIRGLANIQDRLAGATVVAFDMEGFNQHPDGRYRSSEESGELGVAVLRPSSKPLRFFSSMYHFYNQNEIEAFTIRIQERRYGPVVGTMTDETKQTAGARLHKFLSSIPGELILVGFGMQREFKWISDEYPAIAALFTSWCDIQELVADSYKSMTAEPDKLLTQYREPSLDRVMKALKISGWRSRHQKHGAAGDAVKFLAVLSALFWGRVLHELPKPSICRLSRLPHRKYDEYSGKRNARITAWDGSKLPLQTPNGLADFCALHHGLLAVGLDAIAANLARDRKRIWWVSFLTKEALDEFIAKVHGSLYEGVKLFVTPMAPPNKYLAAKRSNEMPWKQPRTVSRYDGDDLIAAFE